MYPILYHRFAMIVIFAAFGFVIFHFFEEEKSSLPRPYTLGISNVTLHFFGIPPPELHVDTFCGFGTLPQEKTILSS